MMENGKHLCNTNLKCFSHPNFTCIIKKNMGWHMFYASASHAWSLTVALHMFPYATSILDYK